MSNQFHLINDPISGNNFALIQGITLSKLVFKHADNLVGWIPSGQIRRNFKTLESPTAVPLATYQFAPIVWVDVAPASPVGVTHVPIMRSIIRPILDSDQTQALPITPAVKNEYIVGKNVWIHEIKLTAPTNDPITGKPEVIVICPPSYVQVVGGVF